MDIAGPFHVTIGTYPDTSAEIETPVIQGCVTAVGIVTHSNTGNFSIATKGADGTPAQTIFDKDSIGSDGWHYPRVQIQTVAGVNINGLYEEPPVFDKLVILVEGASPGDEFDVTLLVD